jgi:hypothetical protein
MDESRITHLVSALFSNVYKIIELIIRSMLPAYVSFASSRNIMPLTSNTSYGFCAA